MHDRLLDRLQRLGQTGADQIGIGLIGDDEEFAVDETIGTRGIARPCGRHRRKLEQVFPAHRNSPLLKIVLPIAAAEIDRDVRDFLQRHDRKFRPRFFEHANASSAGKYARRKPIDAFVIIASPARGIVGQFWSK